MVVSIHVPIMLMYTFTFYIPISPRSNDLRLLALGDTDPPDPQILSILKSAIVLRVGKDHCLTCQGQGVHQLAHALRVREAMGQVWDGCDPDRYRHALCEESGLVQRMAGVVQRIVVIENQFRQIGSADILVILLFLSYRATISQVPKHTREDKLTIVNMREPLLDDQPDVLFDLLQKILHFLEEIVDGSRVASPLGPITGLVPDCCREPMQYSLRDLIVDNGKLFKRVKPESESFQIRHPETLLIGDGVLATGVPIIARKTPAVGAVSLRLARARRRSILSYQVIQHRELENVEPEGFLRNRRQWHAVAQLTSGSKFTGNCER